MDLDSGNASGTSTTPASDEVFDLDIDTGEFEADETELKTIMAEVAQSAPLTDRVPVRPRIRKIASDDINMDEAEAYFKNLSSNRPKDEDEEEDDSEGVKPKRRSFHTRVRCPEEKAKLGENIHGYSGMQPALMPNRPRRRSPSPIRPPPAVTPPPPVLAPSPVATEPSPKTAVASSSAPVAFPSISIVPGQTNLIMVNGQACYITLIPAGVPGPAAAAVSHATVTPTTATVTPESASAAFTPEGTTSYLNMLQNAVTRGSLAVRKVNGDASRKDWRGRSRSRSRSPAYRDRAEDEDRKYRSRGKSQKSFDYSEREKDSERRDRHGRNLPRRSLPEDGGDGRYYDRRSPAHDRRRSSPYNDHRSPPRREDKSVRPVTSAPLPRSNKPLPKEKELMNPATFKLAARPNGQDLFFVNSKPATLSPETLKPRVNKRPQLINLPLRNPVKSFKKDNKQKNEPPAKTAFVDSVPEHSVQEVNSHNLFPRMKGRTLTDVHTEKPDYERGSFRFPRAVNEALCWVPNEEALFQPSETPAWSPRRTLLVTPQEKPVVYENYLKRRSLSPEIPPPPRRAPREGYFNGGPTHAPSGKSGNQAASVTRYETPVQMAPYQENRASPLLPFPALLPTPRPVEFLSPPPAFPAASVNSIMKYEPADHGFGNTNGYLSGSEVRMTGVPLPLQTSNMGYSSSMRPAAQPVQTSNMNFSLDMRSSTQLPMPTTSDTGPRFQLETAPARADGLPPQPSSSGNGTRFPDPYRPDYGNGLRYHDRDEPEFSSFGDRSSVPFPRKHGGSPSRQREITVYEPPTRPSHPAAKKPSIFLRLS